LARRYECLLYCDEAHATGVIGETGRGTLEYYGIENAAEIIQMATLSKALGGLGAFVAGTKTLRDYLVQKARSFIYTTALPPAWCRVAMEALRILKTDPSLIGRLRRNIKIFRQGLQESGFQLLGDATPIIPVLTKEVAITMEFSRRLFKEGILAQGIRPPTVSRGQCRVRFTVMATHKEEELREALAVIVRVGRELGLSAKKRVKG
jgi:glycine C-acetyltransferase